MNDFNKIFELHKQALELVKKYSKHREMFNELNNYSGKHFIGLVGPRGVGKSILLRQIAFENNNSIYISLDALKDFDLYEIVKKLNDNYKISLFLLDEIHFYKNYENELKKIYDFLDVKIIFTSSVSISIRDSSYDLSRRILIKEISAFTFREFLFFKYNVNVKPLGLIDVFNNNYDNEYLEYGSYFKEYISGGLLPYSLEDPDPIPLYKNILEKILYKDIPNVKEISLSEIENISKLIEFVSRAEVEGINYTSLSKNLQISKYKAEIYVKLLEKAFLLQIIEPYGTNVLREPKILAFLPLRLLYRDFSECIGALREDFFTETLRFSKCELSYLKSNRGEKTPDYLVKIKSKKYLIEIGGKGKGRSQFKGLSESYEKFVFIDDVVRERNKAPLFLVGML